MKLSGILFSLLTLEVVRGNNSDLFNYGMADINENGVTSYGQESWGDVSCSDLDNCVSDFVDLLTIHVRHANKRLLQ